jgi:hypothetical protein
MSQRPQVKRRKRSATAAVKKSATLIQNEPGTQVMWGPAKPRPTKR